VLVRLVGMGDGTSKLHVDMVQCKGPDCKRKYCYQEFCAGPHSGVNEAPLLAIINCMLKHTHVPISFEEHRT
jgi:hypothetical protein